MSEYDQVQIDDAAVVWSVPWEERSERLASQPLVIVMHGRGSHEADLPTRWPHLPAGAVYASLRAPLSAAPWNMGGWTWFDLTVPGPPSRASVDAAVAAVLGWLDRVESEHGAPTAVAGLGFSQGGMMSMELLRAAPHRFAAAVDLSGVVGVGEVAGDEVLAGRRPPIFWGRDLDDPAMTAEAVGRTEAFLAGHATATERRYPGIAHSISLDELADVSEFLTSSLPIATAAQS
ncbi:phospholipase [Herbiconiux moechotypicola]|uniref:Dienelactone hydrolase family protein n=1 Tax=Herbiconiux moechotypicola TaxID=637393 RepID=A0ABP5QTB1_9MICO|nr:phospholipase [Herbiconiux moechotypicola]MCS5730498.1 phospholipase [Herbiconiux moechotypicola]